MENNQNNNMRIYSKVREVPTNAQKDFRAFDGKTLTEIDPMWRISKLTEIFGPCGLGWYTRTVKEDAVPFSNGETCVFTEIELYVKDSESGAWSQPIRGAGGNRLVLRTSGGMMADDEAYKKAYTDALGNACKMLGFGADIYWSRGCESKYVSGTATIADALSEKKAETAPVQKVNPVTVETGKTLAEPTANPKTPIKPMGEVVEERLQRMREKKPNVQSNPRNENLPDITPEKAGWPSIVAWMAKMPKSKPNDVLLRSIRCKYNITDENWQRLMKEAGRL